MLKVCQRDICQKSEIRRLEMGLFLHIVQLSLERQLGLHLIILKLYFPSHFSTGQIMMIIVTIIVIMMTIIVIMMTIIVIMMTIMLSITSLSQLGSSSFQLDSSLSPFGCLVTLLLRQTDNLFYSPLLFFSFVTTSTRVASVVSSNIKCKM